LFQKREAGQQRQFVQVASADLPIRNISEPESSSGFASHARVEKKRIYRLSAILKSILLLIASIRKMFTARRA
jgi:hypothetical protein